MKVYEYFNIGQEVYVLTRSGLCKGEYRRKNTATTIDVSFQLLAEDGKHLEHSGYKDEYGVSQNYGEFPEKMVFSSKEAAKRYLLYGETESLPIVCERESAYNVGDHFYYVDEKGLHDYTVSSVRWRLGQWEYHCNWGGCAAYLEGSRGQRYFHTAEEAVEAYLNR